MRSFISEMVIAIATKLFVYIDSLVQASVENSPDHNQRLARLARQPPQARGLSNPPQGVTWDPIESSSWYTCFYDQVFAAAHEDGESVVVFEPADIGAKGWLDPDEEREQPAKHLARVYDVLFGRSNSLSTTSNHDQPCSHSRIVKRICNILPGIRIARPGIRPLTNLTLPILSLPIPPNSSWNTIPSLNESALLTLFHRWSLQVLSAMSFCHKNQIYLENFSAKQVWVQSDFSIAITGFTAASIPAPRYTYAYSVLYSPYRVSEWEHDYATGDWVPVRQDTGCSYSLLEPSPFTSTNDPPSVAAEETRFLIYPYDALHEESFRPENVVGEEYPLFHPKVDIFSWATFVFRLTKNCFSKADPCADGRVDIFFRPVDGCSTQKFIDTIRQGTCPNGGEEWQGSILVKAWNGGYESTEEVMVCVREAIERLGFGIVDGDEVHPMDGRPWEDVFEVVKGRKENRRVDVDDVWAREVRFR